MRKCRYELPENVVSFLREYNKMYILDSGSETRLEFEKVANEMTNGIIEDYISPAKRIDGYSNSRGIVVQIFCKKTYNWRVFVLLGRQTDFKMEMATIYINAHKQQPTDEHRRCWKCCNWRQNVWNKKKHGAFPGVLLYVLITQKLAVTCESCLPALLYCSY